MTGKIAIQGELGSYSHEACRNARVACLLKTLCELCRIEIAAAGHLEREAACEEGLYKINVILSLNSQVFSHNIS